MLIAYYNGATGWRYSVEPLEPRWSDIYYPPNACEWIVPGVEMPWEK
jgi:hypothetical protein